MSRSSAASLTARSYPTILLLIMYTEHRTHVEWNGSHSRWFPVLNGVKQGGVLSPIYIDGLLNKLNSSMTGCCIGSQFTGVLGGINPPQGVWETPWWCAQPYFVLYLYRWSAEQVKL